ncbi:hypothetical protein Tco_0177878 [Tanacetum coccineum]
MNTTQAQQKALDDALVTPADHFEFGKCNMRLKTDIKPKKLHFKWSSNRFTINKNKVSLDVEIFKEFLQICPKIPRQEFEDLLLEQEVLSFIRDLRHTGDITYLTDHLTNQAMLESKAYQTYYAFASGEKAPKPKYVRKKVDSDTSPKKKHVQATKSTRLKSKAKVAKPDKKKQPAKKTKAKGLTVLSKVALTEAEQLKLATVGIKRLQDDS